jgi:hypothetical protein
VTYAVERFRSTDGRRIAVSEQTGKQLTTELDLLMYEQDETEENWRYAFGTRPWLPDEIEFDTASLQISRVVEQTRSNREDYIEDKDRRFANAQLRFSNVFAPDASQLFSVPSDSLLPLTKDRRFSPPYDVTTLNQLAFRAYRYFANNGAEDSAREKNVKKHRQKKQERRYGRLAYSYATSE